MLAYSTYKQKQRVRDGVITIMNSLTDRGCPPIAVLLVCLLLRRNCPCVSACVQVRFDAPPSMASKAFNSEEVQRVLLLQPGSHYQVDTEVYTTAMYGDQFTVLSRYTLAAKGAGKTHLHVSYAIAFKPSLSRLMKPMVAKGVDGEWRE